MSETKYNSNHRPDVSFVWDITNKLLWNIFKKSEVGDVLLPFMLLRRLDCILAPVNENVRKAYANFQGKVAPDKLVPILHKAAGGLKYYNISRHTLTSLTDDAANVELNFKSYLNGFNNEVIEILNYYQFDKVVAKLVRNGILYQMIQEITALDFSIEKIDNHDMGYVFEEVIRIANEQSNEQAGEHFTPRDVIRLMSAILFTPNRDMLNRNNIIRTIYDPTCGTGGMVNVGKKYIYENLCDDGVRPEIQTFGQEINEQSFAIAKSDALVTGENADNIKLGNTLTNDQFKTSRFHYIMANPPYGVNWQKDKEFVVSESLNPDGRFSAGTPRTSDGQLLFVQHMLSKMEPDGSRVGVVTNGSPLFSGGAGSGESNIRKWMIENDWLECIIALPKDLFYNTGISTYLWFFTNKKEERRRGKVQLINAADISTPAMKSLGNKRNDILPEQIEQILKLYLDFVENDCCKIMGNREFGFYQLTIEQPQRDDDGNLVKDRRGNKVADTSKRDSTENVGLDTKVKEHFATEVLPHIDPESWIDVSKTKIGYEINFNQYFAKFEEMRSSVDAKQSYLKREAEITALILDLFN